MDTWATSSLSPQIVGQWLADPALYARVFPFSLRPQAHEIIRTWAFYTITQSQHHFSAVPWKEVAISGWGLAPEGTGKISKSRGGGPMAPMEMIEKYSADAVRYWAASTSFGKDAYISEEKVQAGAKLVTKLWNVAQFSQRFLEGYGIPDSAAQTPTKVGTPLSLADRWILSRTQRLIRRVTELYRDYEYATAKSETEAFLWKDLTDNYLEMTKLRLYEGTPEESEGARWTLYHVFLTVLKLLAPILPYVTEEIHRHLFAASEGNTSIHLSRWPMPDVTLENGEFERAGEALLEAVTAVRRYKTEQGLALSAALTRLQLATQDAKLAEALRDGIADITSVTRARQVEISQRLDQNLQVVKTQGAIAVGLARDE
jgi:valyl-tRNA synthetase